MALQATQDCLPHGFRARAFILVRMVIDFDGRCRITEGYNRDLARFAKKGGGNEIVGANIRNLYVVADPWLMGMNAACSIFE
jgi:hypothetical protein